MRPEVKQKIFQSRAGRIGNGGKKKPKVKLLRYDMSNLKTLGAMENVMTVILVVVLFVVLKPVVKAILKGLGITDRWRDR